jgi:twitching motility protein PilI
MTDPSEVLVQLHDYVKENSIAAPQKVGDDSWQAVAFLVGDARLLVNMQEISEVIEVPNLTLLPGVQPWIAGLANVRGVTLPLVDMGLYLDKEASRSQARCHVISLDRPDTRFGLIVDQVIGMRQVNNQSIKSIDEATGESTGFENYLSGSVEIADELWQIFDTDRLIFSDKFRHVAAA